MNMHKGPWDDELERARFYWADNNERMLYFGIADETFVFQWDNGWKFPPEIVEAGDIVGVEGYAFIRDLESDIVAIASDEEEEEGRKVYSIPERGEELWRKALAIMGEPKALFALPGTSRNMPSPKF